MKECYLCDKELTQANQSKEHIILNAIGGRLKPKDLLCKTCNSTFGDGPDAELAKQLSFWCTYLQIKRDEGENQIIKGGVTKSGEKYNLLEGGKPSLSKPKFNKVVDGNNVSINIKARSEEEMIEMLKDLKKKFPQIDIESAKNALQIREEYLNEPLEFNTVIGGEAAFRSITKTAVNFYIHSLREKTEVQHLFPYLKGENKLEICKHFHSNKAVYKKEAGEVIHLIHLFGSKRERTLFCYVELFSAYSFLVMLSDNYTGKNFEATYGYNVLTYKEIKRRVKLKVAKLEFDELKKLNANHFTAITSKITRLLEIGNKVHVQNEINRISTKAVESVFSRHKNEKYFTEQMANELSREVAERYVKFAYRKRNKTY